MTNGIGNQRVERLKIFNVFFLFLQCVSFFYTALVDFFCFSCNRTRQKRVKMKIKRWKKRRNWENAARSELRKPKRKLNHSQCLVEIFFFWNPTVSSLFSNWSVCTQTNTSNRSFIVVFHYLFYFLKYTVTMVILWVDIAC